MLEHEIHWHCNVNIECSTPPLFRCPLWIFRLISVYNSKVFDNISFLLLCFRCLFVYFSISFANLWNCNVRRLQDSTWSNWFTCKWRGRFRCEIRRYEIAQIEISKWYFIDFWQSCQCQCTWLWWKFFHNGRYFGWIQCWIQCCCWCCCRCCFRWFSHSNRFFSRCVLCSCVQ